MHQRKFYQINNACVKLLLRMFLLVTVLEAWNEVEMSDNRQFLSPQTTGVSTNHPQKQPRSQGLFCTFTKSEKALGTRMPQKRVFRNRPGPCRSRGREKGPGDADAISRRARGLTDDPDLAPHSRQKTWPRDHIPFIACAGGRHAPYFIGWYHVIPNIHSTQNTNKCLMTRKSPFWRVLLLPKNDRPSGVNGVPHAKPCRVRLQASISVNFPFSLYVFPSEANMVPIAIRHRKRVTERNETDWLGQRCYAGDGGEGVGGVGRG